MIENNLRYGIISTYDCNWFLQRGGDDRNTIYISDTITFNHNNPTVLKSYAYIVLKAKQNHYLQHPNIISVQNITPPSNTSLVQLQKNKTNYNHNLQIDHNCVLHKTYHQINFKNSSIAILVIKLI